MFDLFLEPLLIAQLQIVNLAVETLFGKQFGMGAALYNAALIHHDNQVGLADGRKALGNHKCGAAPHEGRQRFLDEMLGL